MIRKNLKSLQTIEMAEKFQLRGQIITLSAYSLSRDTQQISAVGIQCIKEINGSRLVYRGKINQYIRLKQFSKYPSMQRIYRVMAECLSLSQKGTQRHQVTVVAGLEKSIFEWKFINSYESEHLVSNTFSLSVDILATTLINGNQSNEIKLKLQQQVQLNQDCKLELEECHEMLRIQAEKLMAASQLNQALNKNIQKLEIQACRQAQQKIQWQMKYLDLQEECLKNEAESKNMKQTLATTGTNNFTVNASKVPNDIEQSCMRFIGGTMERFRQQAEKTVFNVGDYQDNLADKHQQFQRSLVSEACISEFELTSNWDQNSLVQISADPAQVADNLPPESNLSQLPSNFKEESQSFSIQQSQMVFYSQNFFQSHAEESMETLIIYMGIQPINNQAEGDQFYCQNMFDDLGLQQKQGGQSSYNTNFNPNWKQRVGQRLYWYAKRKQY